MCFAFRSSVINLIYSKELDLLYGDRNYFNKIINFQKKPENVGGVVEILFLEARLVSVLDPVPVRVGVRDLSGGLNLASHQS
jgi:hypothetical protein